MKKIKLILTMIFLILWMSIVHSVTVEYLSPIDEFYLIKGGEVMGNITFEVNATPTGTTGAIMNVSLYTNISGSWKVNFTNNTIGTAGAEINRIFASHNTSIFSADLSDGLVFIWNAYACDNISIFYNEDVSLDSDIYTIFDNYTNTTGDGFCVSNSSCSNAHIITAGRGRVVHYPLASIDGVANTTSEGILPGDYKLNGSAEGYFYINQTRKNYNGTDGLISTESLVTSSVKVNYTISSTCRFIGSNRTVYVEDAPSVTLNSPSDSGYSTSSTLTINYTVTGDDSTYLCYIYSNDTGSWVQEAGASTATNNTPKLTSKVFTEGNVLWNIRCQESSNSNIYGWASNRTVTVDTTNPSITLNTPSDNAYVKYVIGTDSYSAIINLTVTDTNADSCTLKVNGSANITKSYTSGTHFDLRFNATDGNYAWNILCNDSSGRTAATTNRTITIDTITPKLIRNVNYTNPTADCEGFTVDFTSSEAVNLTFKYGLTSMSQTHSSIETDYAINQTVTLTFNDTYETTYYWNISICDRANNCNGTTSSYAEQTIVSPIPLCTGWTLWSIYDTAINLSDYRLASGADYVYYWNNTGQSWIYSSAAGSSNEGYNMGIGDVVQLYESTNTTYFRNNTGTPGYHINITGGHTYFGLYHAYTFGNISYNLFKNESGGNFTPGNIWAGGLDFGDITYFSGFNNSNQQFIDAPYLWSWNNDTQLGNYKNGIDTLWAYVNWNISINFTPDGFVLGNWT